MSMFEKYDTLNPDYIPDNTTPKQDFDYTALDDNPFEIAYSIKGHPIGYKWNYGNEFSLKFSASKTIKVADNSIIYNKAGVAPTSRTKGISGQQAYNIVDCKSWTCVGVSSGFYVWIEDDGFIYAIQGTKEISLEPNTVDKEFTVQFYNFRWEPIYSLSALDAADVYLHLNKETNEIFKPGVYYSVSKISDNESVTVHDKQMLIVV